MRNFLLSMAAAGLALTASVVQAQIFDCTMTSGDFDSYVTKEYIFDYDSAANTVLVLDGAIQHFTGGPMAGKVSGNTAARTTFSWTLNITNASGQSARINYSAAVFKADKSAIVTGRVGGGVFRGDWEARGECKVK